jgi:hypothetical protein
MFAPKISKDKKGIPRISAVFGGLKMFAPIGYE